MHVVLPYMYSCCVKVTTWTFHSWQEALPELKTLKVRDTLQTICSLFVEGRV